MVEDHRLPICVVLQDTLWRTMLRAYVASWLIFLFWGVSLRIVCYGVLRLGFDFFESRMRLVDVFRAYSALGHFFVAETSPF